MLDTLIQRYSVVLIPWNIHINYYIKKNNKGNYTLSEWLFEPIIKNVNNIWEIKQKIQFLLQWYKTKWFEVRSKWKKLIVNDIDKLFKYKFGKAKYDISYLATNNFNYYIADSIKQQEDGIKCIERNILFFTKELNEYIGRFTISKLEKYSISIGSIFVNPSKQRMWYFTKVIKEDIFNFIDNDITELLAFSILKRWLWFYEKLETQNRFIFLDENKNKWKFILKR